MGEPHRLAGIEHSLARRQLTLRAKIEIPAIRGGMTLVCESAKKTDMRRGRPETLSSTLERHQIDYAVSNSSREGPFRFLRPRVADAWLVSSSSC